MGGGEHRGAGRRVHWPAKLVSSVWKIPRVPGSDKAKLFCTPEEIKRWKRERGSCADYLSYCARMLQGCSTDAGHDAGVDARGVTGGSDRPGLDATTPPFVPAAARDSKVSQREDGGGAAAQEGEETSKE